jgi:hypothetical protein
LPGENAAIASYCCGGNATLLQLVEQLYAGHSSVARPGYVRLSEIVIAAGDPARRADNLNQA